MGSGKFISVKSKTDDTEKILEIIGIEEIPHPQVKDLVWLHIYIDPDKYNHNDITSYFSSVDLNRISYNHSIEAAPKGYAANPINVPINTFEGFTADMDCTYSNKMYDVKLLLSTPESVEAHNNLNDSILNADVLCELYESLI